MAQVILQHAGAGGDTQRDGVGQLGGAAGADGAAGAHEAVHIGSQLGQQQIQTLQTGGASHKVAVVKGKHHSVAALGIEDIGQVALHAPLQAVGTLQIKAVLIGKRNINMIILRDLQALQICHNKILL